MLYREPEMTCDKCGLVMRVTKSPDATRRWFKKWHKRCGGKPVYTCGIGPFPMLTGQAGTQV